MGSTSRGCKGGNVHDLIVEKHEISIMLPLTVRVDNFVTIFWQARLLLRVTLSILTSDMSMLMSILKMEWLKK